jgi:hypothetical protein
MSPLALLFAVIAADAGAPTSAGEIAVAVADLRAEGVVPEVSVGLSQLLGVEVGRAAGGRFDVLSYDDMRAALDQRVLDQLVGCTEDRCLEEVAALINRVTHLVYGSVGLVEGRTVVSVSLLDLATSRVVARASRTLLGSADDVGAAVQATALEVLAPLLGVEIAGTVTPEGLLELRSARRDKPRLVGLSIGPSYAVTAENAPTLAGLGLSGAVSFEMALPLSWLHAGVRVGGDYQRTSSRGSLTFISFEDGRIINTEVRSETETIGAFLDLSIAARRTSGLILPYARLTAGGGWLSVALGDVIPENDALPLYFTRARGAGDSAAFHASAAAGVELLAADPLAVTVELGVFGYLHGLHRREYTGGAEKTEANRVVDDELGPLVGGVLLVGVAWQG